MDDNLDLDLDNDQITRDTKRIQSLSSKVAEASKERDDATAKAAAEADRASSLEKERDFYASFSQNVTKYPAASEYQDKIKEKVLAGYSQEDAIVSVLNAEGKFSPTAPAPAAPAPAAGGSAPIALPTEGSKSPAEMSRDERRNALMEAEKRGDISLS